MNQYVCRKPFSRYYDRRDSVFCQTCGCKMEDGDKFCPSCGTRVSAPPMTAVSPEPTRAYAEPTKEFPARPTIEYAAADSGIPEEEAHPTMVLDGYEDLSYAQDRFAEPMNPDNPYPFDQPIEPQAKKPVDYQDSFVIQNQPRFQDSGWRDPSQSARRQYKRTTAGRRVVSILLCLLMLLFSFLALIIGTCRIALTESNVRRAYQKGTLADLSITTDEGEKSLSEILMENVVDAKTNKLIPLKKTDVDRFLQGSVVNNFTENLVVDFTQFFIFGKTPGLLNSKSITDFLSSISRDIDQQISYAMSDQDIQYIGQRIDGGDLSFLSIDSNGGYFKVKYGVDPFIISNAFSVWSLAICAGLAVVCVILIFAVNHGNAPAGLSFNGTTMILFGTLNTLIAAALLILSLIKKIFLLSELLRLIAFSMGAVSIVILILGILFAVIKTVLRNRI